MLKTRDPREEDARQSHAAPGSANRSTAAMPAMAQSSSLSPTSPETPTAPMMLLLCPRTSTRAWRRNYASLAGDRESGNKGWVFLSSLRKFSCPEAHSERAPSLAVGNIKSEETGTVLSFESDSVATCVQHNDGERRKVAPTPFRDCRINNGAGLSQCDCRHGSSIIRFVSCSCARSCILTPNV